MSSALVLLVFAGIFEVCWSLGLKFTEGFTKLTPSVLTLLALAASMYLLSRATQSIPIGTAYAIWVGIGAVGAGVIGVVVFKEPLNTARIFFMVLLIVSIIGLKFSSEH